eukprot:CCRYP_009458-RB/>CCRYP_009458-RB protein AED:0.00 eAED:0.00 QI:131/1/1/1/1/1/2/366/587
MEDTVGLGNHIRHDALTGAAAPPPNVKSSALDSSFQSQHHATVFVSASTADAKGPETGANQQYEQQGISCAANDGNGTASVVFATENATTNHQVQPQHTIPLFPAPPPHPPAATQTEPLHQMQHQPLPNFPRPPPAPPSGMFPPPPNIAPIYPTNVQSAVFHPSQAQHPFPPLHPPRFLLPQLPLHPNCPPPSQSPPYFPPPPSVHPNVGPPPTLESNASLHSTQSVSSRPDPHAFSPPQNTVHSSSGQECVRSLPLPHQPNEASSKLIDATQHTEQLVGDPCPNETQSQQFDDPIEKARAIARRFHIESTQRQTAGNGTSPFIPDSNAPSNTNDNTDYLKQRQAHFQKERTKLEKFRLKNLEYVIKHDEMELRRHVECMNQITAFEEKQNIQLQLAQQQQRQRQLKMEQREQQKVQANMLNASGGGIGSRDQQRAERVRKREHLEQATSLMARSNGGANSEEKQRTSLYLTNLPTDGSTTERILQSLFGSYGRLDRVTMYRNRNTGDLKGDGLIVFGREAVEEYQQKGGDGDLVEAVCLQMNGAELPCGTAIGVQPADMSYNKKTNSKEYPLTQNDKNNVVNDLGE